MRQTGTWGGGRQRVRRSAFSRSVKRRRHGGGRPGDCVGRFGAGRVEGVSHRGRHVGKITEVVRSPFVFSVESRVAMAPGYVSWASRWNGSIYGSNGRGSHTRFWGALRIHRCRFGMAHRVCRAQETDTV